MTSRPPPPLPIDRRYHYCPCTRHRAPVRKKLELRRLVGPYSAYRPFGAICSWSAPYTPCAFVLVLLVFDNNGLNCSTVPSISSLLSEIVVVQVIGKLFYDFAGQVATFFFYFRQVTSVVERFAIFVLSRSFVSRTRIAWFFSHRFYFWITSTYGCHR